MSTEQAQRRHGTNGVGGRLPLPSRPGLVIIDLIEGFTNPLHPPGSNLDDVVGATRVLLDRAREAGRPVWFTTIARPAGGGTMSTWLAKMPALACLVEGSALTDVDERLAPHEDEPVLVKQAASAFFGTDLIDRVRRAGCDALIVAGATTSGCVRATVVDACSYDLPAFVVSSCVGDRAVEPHTASLLDIEAKYGDVIDLDEALTLVSAT